MRPLPGHSDYVLCVCFSRDGCWLASCGGDNRVILRDLRGGTFAEVDYHPRNWVRSMAFSPDGRWLALGEHHGQVVLYDRDDRTTVRGPQFASTVSGLAFTPCGKNLAWCDYSGAVGVWTLGAKPGVLSQLDQEQFTIAFSPQGKYLAASGRNGHVQVWPLQAGFASSFQLPWNDPEGCRALTFDARERTLIAGLGSGLMAWEVEQRSCLWEIEHPAVVSGVGLSSDGSLLATGAWDGLVRIYSRDPQDTATPRFQRELSLGQTRVHALALSSDGMIGAVAGQLPDPLVIWDVD